jgi:Nitrate/nitrite transporter
MFILLFTTTGIGNGSTFRMIPVIFLTERQRDAAGKGEAAAEQAIKDAAKEAAAVLGFTSAFAAYGAFFHSQKFRQLNSCNRRPAGSAVRFYRFLPELHHNDLVVLLTQKCRDAVLK